MKNSSCVCDFSSICAFTVKRVPHRVKNNDKQKKNNDHYVCVREIAN